MRSGADACYGVTVVMDVVLVKDPWVEGIFLPEFVESTEDGEWRLEFEARGGK